VRPNLVLFFYGELGGKGGLPMAPHTFHGIFGAPQAKNFGGMLKGTLNLMPPIKNAPPMLPHKKITLK